MKLEKLTLNISTRKITKVIDVFTKHMAGISEELKEMDNRGCPKCGSFEYREEHRINDVGKHKYVTDGKCLECNHEYIKTDKGEVELLSRR